VAGWGPDNTNNSRFIAAPWSTCALWRIGVEVLADQPTRDEAVSNELSKDKVTCKGR
jgi:hypothetical protein